MKRKGSDQRRDEAMEVARGEEGGLQSEPQDLCAQQLYCFVHYLYAACFSFMIILPLSA